MMSAYPKKETTQTRIFPRASTPTPRRRLSNEPNCLHCAQPSCSATADALLSRARAGVLNEPNCFQFAQPSCSATADALLSRATAELGNEPNCFQFAQPSCSASGAPRPFSTVGVENEPKRDASRVFGRVFTKFRTLINQPDRKGAAAARPSPWGTPLGILSRGCQLFSDKNSVPVGWALAAGLSLVRLKGSDGGRCPPYEARYPRFTRCPT